MGSLHPEVVKTLKRPNSPLHAAMKAGESMLRLAQRIYNLLDEIKDKSDEKTYILVAHNGIARVVQSYFHDMTNEEFAAYGIQNCEIKRYDF